MGKHKVKSALEIVKAIEEEAGTTKKQILGENGSAGFNFGNTKKEEAEEVDEMFDVKEVSMPDFSWKVSVDEKAKMDFQGIVIIPRPVYEKLFMYVRNITTEVSGLGLVKNVGNNIIIEDIFIVKQVCSTGNTKLDNEDLSKKLDEIIKSGGDPTAMRLWWHSHANMSVFWSSTDDACCDAYATNSYMVSLVVNHDRDLKCRLDFFHPFRITLDNVPVEVEDNITEQDKLEEKCIKEMKKKVSKREYLGGHKVWRNGVLQEEEEEPDEITEQQKNLFDEKMKAPKRDMDEFSNAYNENDPTNETGEWQGIEITDIIGFNWIWDVATYHYFPSYKNSRILSENEYAYIASLLQHGVMIKEDDMEHLFGA